MHVANPRLSSSPQVPVSLLPVVVIPYPAVLSTASKARPEMSFSAAKSNATISRIGSHLSRRKFSGHKIRKWGTFHVSQTLPVRLLHLVTALNALLR